MNSFNNSSVLFELVHTTASPISKANTKAPITEIAGGIWTLNKIAGNSFNPSTLETIFNLGINTYPAVAEKSAAPTDDK